MPTRLIASLIAAILIVFLGLMVAAWPATAHLGPIITPSPTPYPPAYTIPGGAW
jgi:hypothetical protein